MDVNVEAGDGWWRERSGRVEVEPGEDVPIQHDLVREGAFAAEDEPESPAAVVTAAAVAAMAPWDWGWLGFEPSASFFVAASAC